MLTQKFWCEQKGDRVLTHPCGTPSPSGIIFRHRFTTPAELVMAKALLLSFDETDGYTKRTFVWFKFFLSFSITSESSHFSSVGILWRGSTKHQILHASRMALYGGSSVSKAWCLSWPLMASSFLCCWCDDHNIPSCVDSVAKLESEFTFGWFKGMKYEERVGSLKKVCHVIIWSSHVSWTKHFSGWKSLDFITTLMIDSL